MPEEIEKNQYKLQNTRYPAGDSNQLPSEYKSFKALCHHIPEEIEKSQYKLQNTRYPARDSNQLPSEYKSFKALCHHMPEEIEKSQYKLQNTRYPGGDSNQLPSEYKSYALTTSTVNLSWFSGRIQQTRLKRTSTSCTWQHHQHSVPQIMTYEITILNKKR